MSQFQFSLLRDEDQSKISVKLAADKVSQRAEFFFHFFILILIVHRESGVGFFN
jgi:hypothetical protein